MTWLLKMHEELPSGVKPFPTLRGKKRFEILQAFNMVLAGYILIHQLLVPIFVYLFQVRTQPRVLNLGFWYFYHLAAAFLLSEKLRNSKGAYGLVHLGWFAVGYLPLRIGLTFLDGGSFNFSWKTLSGLISCGSSLVFTFFLLYRMRMPTTAYLFGLESRIIPKWRYAIPYAALGLTCSLFWIFCPMAKRITPTDPVISSSPAVNEFLKRRLQYD